MRHFLTIVGAVILVGADAACEAAGPKWEYGAHSYYAPAAEYVYRVRVYFKVDPAQPAAHLNDFDYSGPVEVDPLFLYRWDRSLHQITLPVNATEVYGLVENKYIGSETWYPVGGFQYVEVP
jgi:hypothetical protein